MNRADDQPRDHGPDEAAILRFASGELDAREEATFLAQCELAPGAWRAVTLAVAEHRRLLQALGELAAGETASPEELFVAQSQPSAWRSRPALAIAALAAGVLIGIVGMRATGVDPAAGNPPARESLRDLPVVAAPPASRRAEMRTSLAAGAPATDMADLLRMAPMIPADERAALGSQGFQVDEEPTLYVVTSKSGARWAVPTQHVTLLYNKQ